MMSNSTKVWIFILTSSLAFLVLGYQFGDRIGLLIGFALALGLNFLVFFYGESHLLAKLHAKPLKGQDAWGLLQIVEKYSNRLDMPAPAVYLTPHPLASAFCVGHSWKRGSLCFTLGMVQKLNQDELEAVVAHQLCHIRRLDSFTFSVSSTLANSICGIGVFLDSFLPSKMRPFFMTLFSPLGWIIIKVVVGQKSFFENDLMASEIIEDRRKLGEVLWRLEGLAQTQPMSVPPCTNHLFIVNPEGFEQKNLFLKSHPSIKVRLQKLMGYYPI